MTHLSHPNHKLTATGYYVCAVKRGEITWRNNRTNELKTIKYISGRITKSPHNENLHPAEWAKRDRERLSEILDNRYQSMPTIITSNMTVDQVEQFLGDRAFDRLQERLVIIRCDWESHRQQNRVVMEL